MRNIVLARIDDRLIHGQVVTSWVRTVDADQILIADDALMGDTFTQRVLKAAAPPGISVDVRSVEDAARYLQEDTRGGRLVLLTKSPQAIEALIDADVAIGRVILGGMGFKAGRTRFNKNVSASPEEIESFRRMLGRGVEIFYQLVPSEVPTNIKKLLEG